MKKPPVSRRLGRLGALAACVPLTLSLATSAHADEPTIDPSDGVYSAHVSAPGTRFPDEPWAKYADITDVYAGHDGTTLRTQVNLRKFITPEALTKTKGAKYKPLYRFQILVVDTEANFDDTGFIISEIFVSTKGTRITEPIERADKKYLEGDCVIETDLDPETATVTVSATWTCDPDGVEHPDGQAERIAVQSEIIYRKAGYRGPGTNDRIVLRDIV